MGIGILLCSSEVNKENTGAGCCPLWCVSCPGMYQHYPYIELSLPVPLQGRRLLLPLCRWIPSQSKFKSAQKFPWQDGSWRVKVDLLHARPCSWLQPSHGVSGAGAPHSSKAAVPWWEKTKTIITSLSLQHCHPEHPPCHRPLCTSLCPVDQLYIYITRFFTAGFVTLFLFFFSPSVFRS